MSKRYTKYALKSNNRKYKVNIEEYNSASEVAHDCETRPMKKGGWHEPEYGEWSGVNSHDEAMELLKNGYEPTVSALKESVKASIKGAGKRISFQNNIQGFAPIVPLAMMNVPNSMIDMQMKPIKTKVIDVYYDMTASCGTSSDRIIKNGQKILKSIMDLEAQGYKFNLYAFQSYANESGADALIVKIKSSSQPFDLKRMSFPLTHTAFFRIIGFDWYSKNPESTFRSCYGHAISRELDAKQIEAMLGKNAVYISNTIMQEDENHIKEVLTNDHTQK